MIEVQPGHDRLNHRPKFTDEAPDLSRVAVDPFPSFQDSLSLVRTQSRQEAAAEAHQAGTKLATPLRLKPVCTSSVAL